MDKYTYSLKVEKIQKLVRQEEYVQAAKIADTMEWGQERNVRLLTSVAEAYEKTDQYPKAIEVLLTAYERSSVGKRIMYKLTELAIGAGDLEDAETFYRKYLEEAPDENNRFILRYKIAEAKGEDLDKRITILETYKKYEFEEEWACRLAELYQQAGEEKKCVALCDEIILWFGVGPYVDRAMELKEMFQPLTDAQREHRENREYFEARVKAVANEMAEATAQKTAVLEEPEPEEEPAEETPAEEDELPVIAISDEVAATTLAGAADVMLAPEPELPVIPEVADEALPVIHREETEEAVPEPQAPVRAEEPVLPEAEPASAPESPAEEPAASWAEPEEKIVLPAAEEPETETVMAPEPEWQPETVTAPEPEWQPEEEAPSAVEELSAPEEVQLEMPSMELPETGEIPVETVVPKVEIPAAQEEIPAPDLPDMELSRPDLPEERPVGGTLPEPVVPEPEEAGRDAQDLEDAIHAALAAEAKKERRGMYTKEPATPEQMANTRSLKDILRRTLGASEEPENLEPTKEIILPAEYKMDSAKRKQEDNMAEIEKGAEEVRTEEAAVSEAKPEGAAREAADAVRTAAAEQAEAPAAKKEETQIPLADDASVLPVISYEETERAAWENHAARRIQEPDPLESREMERCLFVKVGEEEDRVGRAVAVLENFYRERKMEVGPIAKIAAAKLNQRGLVKSLPALNNKDLIVDQAEGLSVDLIRELLRVVRHLDTDKVFVLMDGAEQIERLKQRVRSQMAAAAVEQPAPEPEVTDDDVKVAPAAGEAPAPKRAAKKVRQISFDRMDPKQELTEKEFIRYADYFAHELECVIDDSGFDALEDEIDAIHQEGGRLLAGEVEDIIEDAAEHASKPSVRRIFGSKYDKDGFLILRGRDFR